MGIKLAQIVLDTCVWPLYEVDSGKYKVNYKPNKKKLVLGWLKPQGRFRHLFKEGNTWMLETIQKDVDREWDELLKLEASAE
jgi:pyruvate ferredoxin oxidoreductase beta subunit